MTVPLKQPGALQRGSHVVSLLISFMSLSKHCQCDLEATANHHKTPINESNHQKKYQTYMWFIVLLMHFRIGTQLLASSTKVSPKQDSTAPMPLAMLLSHSDSMDVNVWARVPSICHTDLDCRMTKFKALNPRVKKVIASTVWSAVNLCCCSKSFILHSRLMCHTIPFCKNKRGTYTMHMISWE